MAETPSGTAYVSAPASEKSARSPASASLAPGSSSTTHKLRSCVVCRSRKVRCDKQSPCSNCRRANIPCTVASDDRPPRWARRLERLTNRPPPQETGAAADPATGQVMDRLRSLEKMVKELGDQLEQANAGKASSSNSPSGLTSHGSVDQQDQEQRMQTSSTTSIVSAQPKTGRLVGKDGGKSQYIGSSFWSRVSDELDALKADTQDLADGDSDMSDDENDSISQTVSTRESERGPSERNGLLFGHNLGHSAPDLRQFRPLPSQIPFLVDVFAENVNFCLQIVHMPVLRELIRETRLRNWANVSPSNEALIFAVYYSAVTSMADEDVVASFGTTKAELNYKFRLGLEHALARADFIRLPDVTLVQAFIIFLCLARRHDSPRYVWMMTGLAARMAVAVGLHRDGSHFAHLSPYEAEVRRRIWWSLLLLDVRASEDQGTEFTIANGSFDTKMPLSINDADLDPRMTEAPADRGLSTDMLFAMGSYRTCQVSRRVITARTAEGAPDVAQQNRLLDEFREDVDKWSFGHQVGELTDVAYWVGVRVMRLVMSKLRLFIHLPSLLAPEGQHVDAPSSAGTRDSVLVAAIEVAEFNHALSGEPASRPWRWIMDTYTHWHAIVYLLIETSRRPWSPVAERAWVALHSKWLIPAQPKGDRSLRVWIPLRRLMGRARRHREAELRRLRGDAAAVRQAHALDSGVPVPVSSGPFKSGNSFEAFTRHWYDLVASPAATEDGGVAASSGGRGSGASEQLYASMGQSGEEGADGTSPFRAGEQTYSSSAYSVPANNALGEPTSRIGWQTPGGPSFALPADWARDGSTGFGLPPGSWDNADAFESFGGLDIDMSEGEDMNWKEWLESAAIMELDAMQGL